MHIRGVYKKYTRVGDFDTPTHQPTSGHIQCEEYYTYVSTLYTITDHIAISSVYHLDSEHSEVP